MAEAGGVDMRMEDAKIHRIRSDQTGLAIAQAGGIFLDWDGCVTVGNRMLPATRRLLARHADRIVVISNNSTHLPGEFSLMLARWGIDLPPSRIVLAGAEAVAWTARQPSAPRVLLLGSPQMTALARRSKIDLVRDWPDLVLLMRDTRFNYAKLQHAASAIRRGARLVVANLDATHPGPNGESIPETGALLAAIAACTAVGEMTTIGKPSALLFERACALLGIGFEDAVMIGDNPDTDIAGAEALGIRSILVDAVALTDPYALVA